MRADIARLAHPAPGGAVKAKKKKKKAAAKTSRWSEYEQLAITRAVAEGKRVHHVVVQIDPQCAMPIAGRQMIQLALAGLGEVLALYPVEGSLEPITRIEAALASEKPAEQIRTKCSIPTIALNVRVTPLRAQAPSHPLPQVPAADSEAADSEARPRPRRRRPPRPLPASLPAYYERAVKPGTGCGTRRAGRPRQRAARGCGKNRQRTQSGRVN